MMRKISYCAHSKCRNGIGLAGSRLLHDVIVEVLKWSGLSGGEGVSSGLGGCEEGRGVEW